MSRPLSGLLATAFLLAPVVLLLRADSGGAHTPLPTLEEARDEVAAGRYWHATEILLAMEESAPLAPEARWVLARARAGYRDWPGVAEALEEAEWVQELAPVEGPYLLGRARAAEGDWEEAVRHYRTALGRLGSGPAPFPMLAAAVEAETRVGGAAAGLDLLEARGGVEGIPGAALAWTEARRARDAGDTTRVRAFLARVGNPILRGTTSDFLARAVLEAGDSTRAEALFAGLAEEAEGATRAGHAAQAARLKLARGDSAGARSLFRDALAASPFSRGGGDAAAGLFDLDATGELDLVVARSLDRAGDGERALAAYDGYVARVRREGGDPDVRARVERARLASTVPSRVEEAVEEFRALDEHPDPAVGARVLDVWAGLRRRQGQTGNVQTLRRWLVERYPDTDEAAEIVFLRGDGAQDRQAWDEAVRHYRQVAEMAPERALAGRARMRVGQIQAHTGRHGEAAATFQAYLEDFPRGRRWSEAAFWAGRSLLAVGDTVGAREYLARVLEGDPFSYYAAEAEGLLGREYRPQTPARTEVEPDASWVRGAMMNLDALESAGLVDAAGVLVDAWVDRADAEGPAAQYPLAEGLIARGWTIEGINRGWALVRDGEPWNGRLVRIIYPFPQQDMVLREAREYGLDPLLMAALIRQESAWDRDIVSSAGAIGLMQVMPATGRQLARAVGPVGFSSESLETAEVNLHLGARFLRDMLERFGPELPLVLSAYNAGPTRANRWKNYPEAGDRLTFTERIPFTETRGYVKNVTRNLALYRALYGEELGTPVMP